MCPICKNSIESTIEQASKIYEDLGNDPQKAVWVIKIAQLLKGKSAQDVCANLAIARFVNEMTRR